MEKYSLTEKQKILLRSLVPSLSEGTLHTIGYVRYIGGAADILVSEPNEAVEVSWKNANVADFDLFAHYSLFLPRNSSDPYSHIYTPNAQMIIDAVNSNFGEGDTPEDGVGRNNHLIFDPVFGVPPKSSQYLADIFMLMPFHESFRPIYYDHVKPAAQELGRSINRGDDFFSKHSIMTDIWSAIYHSRLVIADCTGKNANVFYELGIAHTVGKPVIMITQNESDIPFDVGDKRYIKYTYPADIKLFEQQLKDAILKVLGE